jgi:hypothetical protein
MELVFLSRLQFALVISFHIIFPAFTIACVLARSYTRLSTVSPGEVRKMASPFKRLAGRVLRTRPRFRGRSPAAVALRCGAVLAALALGGVPGAHPPPSQRSRRRGDVVAPDRIVHHHAPDRRSDDARAARIRMVVPTV